MDPRKGRPLPIFAKGQTVPGEKKTRTQIAQILKKKEGSASDKKGGGSRKREVAD